MAPAAWVIGAAPDCDIVVQSNVVSSHHCRLLLQGTQYVLEDLGSRNGTFVNGHRLQASAPVYVSPADVVLLANSLAFPWPGGAPPATTVAPAVVITIGRNPASDVHLDYPMISWDHARIHASDKGWMIEDLRSTNGTSL